MNAAKAKAAARQAAANKSKSKAAAAAAPIPSATSASSPATRSSRPLTQPWADPLTGPGGGIIRLAYDLERWQRAVQEIIVEPERLTLPQANSTGADGESAEKVELKKEDVALLMNELELSNKDAEVYLRRAKGDLGAALLDATAPVKPREALGEIRGVGRMVAV